MKRFSMLSPRNLVRIAVVLLGLSLFQLATDGEINWHRQALDTFSGTRGEDTGWGKAVDSLETAGAAREGQAPTQFDLTGRVVRIADGDTLSLLDAGSTRCAFTALTPQRGTSPTAIAPARRWSRWYRVNASAWWSLKRTTTAARSAQYMLMGAM